MASETKQSIIENIEKYISHSTRNGSVGFRKEKQKQDHKTEFKFYNWP